MSNGDGVMDEEYDIDPWWAMPKEAAQRNINEYSELTHSYVDEGLTEKSQKQGIF